MDAQAHLLALGWAGPGHALDSRPSLYKQKGHRGLAYDPLKVGNTGSGLVKPLSISRRKDRFGIGKKAHEPSKGNEWWLKGFESALGNIGKDEAERKQEETNGTASRVLLGRAGEKYGGLYGFFIKGQMMEGSLGKGWEALVNGANDGSRKRKSDVLEEDAGRSSTDSANEDDATKLKKRRKQKHATNGLQVSPVRRPAETTGDFATVGAFLAERDKDKKKSKRADKMADGDQFAQIGAFFGEREKDDGTKSATRKDKDTSSSSKKKRKSEALANINGHATNGDDRTESKEERRERRRKRREEKQRREGAVADKPARSKDQGEQSEEDDAARKARKAEKKRRKAERLAHETTK